MCVFGPGPLWFKGHWQCHCFSHLLCPLSCFNPLELCFAVQPAGSQPQGASECPDHVLPGSQLWQHPSGGLEGSAGLSPGALQGQTAAAANG